ncbi:unnamed protein product [Vitrella brassicaformis CCMP3155]|uniref:Uncharacterized protein n=1 Tax=Vitrella brassicaformis (strain CCMP3155) TaxID=1169540 RepID=A0A0G4E902_VITBC|nr:unnamed protein product [Vitrella brassicaformis CCMP3155]|eukprot:CEL91681.1 unnamed protein product [Vitrella brassicaformis CCMP3155]
MAASRGLSGLSALLVVVIITASGLLAGARRGVFWKLDARDCGCECCLVASRLASEKLAGIDKKCTPPVPDTLHPDGALSECHHRDPCRLTGNTILTNAEFVPLKQWCYYACELPSAFAAIGTPCQAISGENVLLAQTGDGNGRDAAHYSA